MSCPTNMSVNPNDKSTFCGTEEKGGSTCLANCCDKQVTYCNIACFGNDKCQDKCLNDRGCLVTGFDLTLLMRSSQHDSNSN